MRKRVTGPDSVRHLDIETFMLGCSVVGNQKAADRTELLYHGE